MTLTGEQERPPREQLSDREYQVLCMIASGKTVGQIAAELSLSVKAISTYRARAGEDEDEDQRRTHTLRHQPPVDRLT